VSYVIAVRDTSSTGNFHLVGRGVNGRTGKAFKGRWTGECALRPVTFGFGGDPRLGGVLRVRA